MKPAGARYELNPNKVVLVDSIQTYYTTLGLLQTVAWLLLLSTCDWNLDCAVR